jgi:hypothetical protein
VQLSQRPFRVFAHLLSTGLIRRAARRAGCALGAGPLNLVSLTWLALACAYHKGRSFADVLGLTLELLADLAEGPDRPRPATPRPGRRNDPRVADPDRLSAQAFTQARRRLPWAFWLALIALLADDFEQDHQGLLLWRGRYRLLCLDGTTLDLPNDKALAAHFGSAGRGKGRAQVQARLVLLQLTGARLPWRFDLTPLAQSEQQVAARLLAELRQDDLVLMDRGFFNYALLQQVQGRRAFFVTRLRKQVKLKELRPLGPGDRLAVWRPASAAARRAIREPDLPGEITLRLIDYQVAGFRPSTVVTNLLDDRQAPAEEFVRLAAQEQGRRIGLADPLRLSYQEALEKYQDLHPRLFRAGPAKIKRHWRPRLLRRISSHEVPWRPGRHYRRPNDAKPKAKGRGRHQPPSKLEETPGAQPAPEASAPKPRE